MAPSPFFVPLEQLDPAAAKQLLPGVRLQVSRRTFAQVAADKLHAANTAVNGFASSPSAGVTPDQAQLVRQAAMAASLPVFGD